MRYVLTILLLCIAPVAAGAADEPALSARMNEAREHFERKIRPVLIRHCYECHSAAADEIQGGLRVDSRDALRTGGESGAAVVPGKPGEGTLLGALRHESFEMPPSGRLPATVVEDFRRWIAQGAFDPREKPPTAADAARLAWQVTLAERRDWWSLQPPVAYPVPDVARTAWPLTDVDRFVLAGLEQQNLAPAADAAPLTLLRRISFVLTGLPPAPELVKDFPARYREEPEMALAALVEGYLASPQYGERMARRWMDVVRYTDTYGYEWDNPARGSWEYRDYLIRAFNQDVGFDQLIREQLAGDLLPEPRVDAEAGVRESLIGPMFYHMGEHRHGDSLDFNGIHQEMVDNKIDAFSKAFLATTVACARCHDHKFDAVAQADYYALAGVFMSPRWTARSLDTPDRYSAQIEELKQLRAEIEQQLKQAWRNSASGRMAEQLQAWAAKQPADSQPALEEVAYPLLAIARATGKESDNVPEAFTAVWQQLASAWRNTRTARQAADAGRFEVLTDFSTPELPPGWVSEGAGFAHGYVTDGTPLVSLTGETAIARLLPRGYHTHALSSKLPGAVRLPSQQVLEGSHLSLNLAGGEWAGWQMVQQNAFQTESIAFFDRTSPGWKSFADLPHKNGVTRVLVEVATSSLNPGFPPRTGKTRAGSTVLPPEDRAFHKRSWFSLTGAVTHDGGAPPAASLDHFAALYEEEAPDTADKGWQRLAMWLNGAVTRYAAGTATGDDVRVLNWLLANGFLPNQLDDLPTLRKLVARYREVEAQIGWPRAAISMDERDLAPLDYRLNIRGDVDREGDTIPRDFLEAFADQTTVGESAGSGRLELARWLSSDRNPQTARVYVNRVWQWVFGTGLVATPNDFGHLGGRPSHPELLDWLARKFMREGWSTKRLLRELLLSRTFRQSGTVSSRGREQDPANRLLHHYPTRRLEAEEVRDALLAVSGRLNPAMYGPPILPPRGTEDPAKRLLSGPLDGDGRRSLYTQISIMAPPEFLVGFNLPDPKLPTGRRDVTNVPAQALIMLNDPLVSSLADHWAGQLLADGHTAPEARLRAMFVRALGRQPSSEELARWSAAVGGFSGTTPLMLDRQAWQNVAHAMFNLREFLYYR